MTGEARHDEIVVYTCVAGRYDRELMPARQEEGVRFVCFTDAPRALSAPGWEMRQTVSPSRLKSGHDVNRFHKVFAHHLFPSERWSVYLDGNLRFDGDFPSLIERVKSNGSCLGAFWHKSGHTLTQEVELCKQIKLSKLEQPIADRQLAHYAATGFDVSQPIPTNNLLVRDHQHPALRLAMSLWWSHLFEFTKRDQISLLYALSQADARWQPLDGEGGLDPALVRTVWHRPPFVQRMRGRLRKHFGITV